MVVVKLQESETVVYNQTTAIKQLHNITSNACRTYMALAFVWLGILPLKTPS